MSDILLVQPPAYGEFMPPLGLATLSAYLRQNEIQPTILDYNIRFYNRVKDRFAHAWNFSRSYDFWADYKTYEKKIKPLFKEFSLEIVKDILISKTEIVGISVLQTGLFPTIDLIETIREFFGQEIKIILGGPSMNPREAERFLNQYGVFCIFEGEAEIGLTAMMKQLKSSGGLNLREIGGAIFRENGKTVFNGKHIVRDLNTLPYPDFSDFKLGDYAFKEKVLPIATSRGCVARCTFCAEATYMERFRELRAQRVVDEIQQNVDRYDVRMFRVNDSLINGNLKNMEMWLDELITRNLKLSFGGVQARINVRMTEKILEKLKRAGCRLIQYGVESGSDRVLKIMKKGISAKDAYEVIGRTHKVGIVTQVNIIVGHFEETFVDYLKTLIFIFRIRKQIQYISVNCYDFTDGSADHALTPNIVNKYSRRWRTKNGLNNYLTRRLRRAGVLLLMHLFDINRT